jgi:hypothetical protein
MLESIEPKRFVKPIDLIEKAPLRRDRTVLGEDLSRTSSARAPEDSRCLHRIVEQPKPAVSSFKSEERQESQRHGAKGFFVAKLVSQSATRLLPSLFRGRFLQSL